MSDFIRTLIGIAIVVYLLFQSDVISLPEQDDYKYKKNEIVMMDNDTAKYKVYDSFMIKYNEGKVMVEYYQLLYKDKNGEVHKTWISEDAIVSSVEYDSVLDEWY